MTVARLLELASPWILIAAGVAAGRLWWRYRTRQAAWIAATFAALDVIVVQGLFVDEITNDALRLVLIGLLVAFPYLLFRFADSVVTVRPVWRTVASALFVLALVPAFLPGMIGETGEARTGLQNLYVLVFMAEWFGLTAASALILYRGRRGQSRVVQRRQTMLATGAGAVGVALLVSVVGSGGSAEPSELTTIITQSLTILAGATFLIGFAPPRFLLASWRHDDERALYEAAVGFVRAESPDEVSAVLVPALQRLLGVEGVSLRTRDGVLLGSSGPQLEDGGARVRRFVAGDLVVLAETSTTTPLFTREEEEVVERLGLLGELALERTRLLLSERQAKADVEALNEELEAFVYTTSHDLKNPIIAILGYLELIDEDHGDELSERVRHYVNRITANADYMQALIHDLLELSRVGRIDVEPIAVDLTSLLDDLAVEVARRAPKATLRYGALPVLWMNPLRVQQLFSNLIDNAVRYSGRPDVTIEVISKRDHLGVTIDVVDDGAGIPKEDRERAFKLFERLDPDASSGTGVGLAICRRIVETSGGSISAIGDDPGTRIRIRLPRSAITVEDTGGMIPLESRPLVRPADAVQADTDETRSVSPLRGDR